MTKAKVWTLDDGSQWTVKQLAQEAGVHKRTMQTRLHRSRRRSYVLAPREGDEGADGFAVCLRDNNARAGIGSSELTTTAKWRKSWPRTRVRAALSAPSGLPTGIDTPHRMGHSESHSTSFLSGGLLSCFMAFPPFAPVPPGLLFV